VHAARGAVRGHVAVPVNVMRTRLGESRTPGPLSEGPRLSRSQLARALKATAGASPVAYLQCLRVQRWNAYADATP
jgi:transcriptional regulator GlxA family with amidase domain